MKKKKPHTSVSCNFRLTGNTSILIGIYILLGSIFANHLITKVRLNEDSWLFFLFDNNIKYTFAAILLLILLLSLLALFLKAKENVNELGFILWNDTSKKSVWQIAVLFLFGFIVANFLFNHGYRDLIIPMYLFCYGILISLLNYTKYTSLYRFSIICSSLGVIAYFFPSYWFLWMVLLGVNHIVHGIIYRD